MRVVQFDAYGDANVLHLAEADVPAPGPSDVRIRIIAAAVNPADFKWRQGMFQAMVPIPLPHVLGYDIAGVIDAIGPEVSGVSVGDRVVGALSPIAKGGYAEYAVLPASEAVPIPGGLDFATAAALPTAGLTGVQMIDEQIAPTAGQTVLVTGAAGAVGRFAVDAAKRLGVRVVAAVRPGQMDEARALGADVIALGEQAWTGAPFDHVADTVGGPAVAELCRHLAPGGKICTAATTPIAADGLASAPVFMAVHSDPAMLAELGRRVAAGEISVPIAKRLPLEHAAEAHRLMEAGGQKGKIILEP